MKIPCPTLPSDKTGISDAYLPEYITSYETVFEDTFDGYLDPDKWATKHYWGPNLIINYEEQLYIDVLGGEGWQGAMPFSFTNEGNLVVTAQPITSEIKETLTGKPSPDGQNFSSGIIQTRESHSFIYGYTEARIKLPCSPDGMWPAFWLFNETDYQNAFLKNVAVRGDGNDGSDKINFESDFEWIQGGYDLTYTDDEGNQVTVPLSYAGSTQTYMAHHYFTGDRSVAHHRWDIDYSNFRQTELPSEEQVSSFNIYDGCHDGASSYRMPTHEQEMCDDFHVYAFDWTADYLRYYIDGVMVNCIESPNDLISDQPMFILINYAVGGAFPFGSPPQRYADQSDYPSSMVIDYVRTIRY